MMNEVKKLDRKIKFFEALRIINPIILFCIILFALYSYFNVPLVLAVSVACLTAAINFTVMNMLLRSLRRQK